MRKHENSSYHKRHKFTEGVSIFYLEQNYLNHFATKKTQYQNWHKKRKSDKQIDLMGMKQEGLLFLHKVFFWGGGGWGRECFACVDRKM